MSRGEKRRKKKVKIKIQNEKIVETDIVETDNSRDRYMALGIDAATKRSYGLS